MYDMAQHSPAAMLEITEGRVSQIKTEYFAALWSYLECHLVPSNRSESR